MRKMRADDIRRYSSESRRLAATVRRWALLPDGARELVDWAQTVQIEEDIGEEEEPPMAGTSSVQEVPSP
jgi:hypothetical protein